MKTPKSLPIKDSSMNLEALAQDFSDKKLVVLDRQVALAEAKLALSEAQTTLSKSLCESGVPSYKQVAISLLHYIVVCRWSKISKEYTMSFVPKMPNVES